ncbi:hypothetical protein M2283_005838 [Streptomyces pseudovenezuelae]|uniref:Uncharacterized protein n=1 Tax=Streptomyces pseudovenezuelae TaxID=67350 RepID=A0ABT6LQF9_9ACTN|nr:hypothetical protein [Streptomyces pseudovenezuelae]
MGLGVLEGAKPSHADGFEVGWRDDQETLRGRIAGDTVVGPDSSFRLRYLEPYAEAARTWLHGEAEVVDTTYLTPAEAALQIAEAVKN